MVLWYKNHEKNEDLNSSNFSRGTFGRPILFVVFKLILVIYWSILWSWRLVDFYILSPAENWEEDKNFTRTREYPDYLTNWGDTIIMLYLLYSTLLAIRIFYLEYRRKTGDIGTVTMGFLENGVKWYYFPAQILFELAAVFALLITILYYGLMGGGNNDILDIHPHVINSKFFSSEGGPSRTCFCLNLLNLTLLFSAVVIFLELAFNRIPFRFFHFIISMCVALMYVLGSWIGYKMNPARNGAYPGIVDWSDNQGISFKS